MAKPDICREMEQPGNPCAEKIVASGSGNHRPILQKQQRKAGNIQKNVMPPRQQRSFKLAASRRRGKG